MSTLNEKQEKYASQCSEQLREHSIQLAECNEQLNERSRQLLECTTRLTEADEENDRCHQMISELTSQKERLEEILELSKPYFMSSVGDKITKLLTIALKTKFPEAEENREKIQKYYLEKIQERNNEN